MAHMADPLPFLPCHAAADMATALTGLPADRPDSVAVRVQLPSSAGGATLTLRISPGGTIEAAEGEALQLAARAVQLVHAGFPCQLCCLQCKAS